MTAPVNDPPVSAWNADILTPICPQVRAQPEPCDCGYTGEWERRLWFEWIECPGHQRGDKQIRRDIAKGLPARHGDEGWWCIAGFDERCPDCGDIERFDWQCNEVARFRADAVVVPFRRRTRRHDRR